jgi:GTP-binding protein
LLCWLRAAGRDFVVVATKIDRLSGNQRTRNLAALKKELEVNEILPVSAKTGYGIRELWSRIEEAGGVKQLESCVSSLGPIHRA